MTSLLGPTGRSTLASTSRHTLQAPSSVRFSHIGAAPLWLPLSTSLTIQPYPPHPNPARPIPPALQKARSILVKGPLGELIVPLHPGVDLEKAEAQASIADEQVQERYNVTIDKPRTEADKKLRAYWGMTRALLQNALNGVSEGHSTYLRLVGVGYRAAIEADPAPPLTKLQKSILPGVRTFFSSQQQEDAYREKFIHPPQEKPQRLVIRLGYSHPVHVSIPRGITATVPQPTRIVLKGIDKDAIGLLAARIRSWRPPEPYKVSSRTATVLYFCHTLCSLFRVPTGQGRFRRRRDDQDQGRQEEVKAVKKK